MINYNLVINLFFILGGLIFSKLQRLLFNPKIHKVGKNCVKIPVFHETPKIPLQELEEGLRQNKQGSLENDGRSNVYDHSEFKVISSCCHTNCCRTKCGHFT